jgi:hypothetical protein
MTPVSRDVINYRPSDNSNLTIQVLVEDESVWLSQSQMIQLFDSSKQNISLHIK